MCGPRPTRRPARGAGPSPTPRLRASATRTGSRTARRLGGGALVSRRQRKGELAGPTPTPGLYTVGAPTRGTRTGDVGGTLTVLRAEKQPRKHLRFEGQCGGLRSIRPWPWPSRALGPVGTSTRQQHPRPPRGPETVPGVGRVPGVVAPLGRPGRCRRLEARPGVRRACRGRGTRGPTVSGAGAMRGGRVQCLLSTLSKASRSHEAQPLGCREPCGPPHGRPLGGHRALLTPGRGSRPTRPSGFVPPPPLATATLVDEDVSPHGKTPRADAGGGFLPRAALHRRPALPICGPGGPNGR